MAPRDGFEPPARRLTVVCSTAELPGNMSTAYLLVFNLIIINCNILIKLFKDLITSLSFQYGISYFPNF